MNLKKMNLMATIFDGHTHIERRVYSDGKGNCLVKINGLLFNVETELKNFDVDVWYCKA